MPEAVADNGDGKLKTLSDCAERDLETSFSEPKVNGQRRWDDQPAAGKSAFDAHHEQVTSDRGKALLRQRGAVVERTFAHLCETGGSRRVTVRGMNIVTAGYQLRAAAHNPSLILRTLLGTGKPRSFSAALAAGWRSLTTLPTLTHAFSKRPFAPTTTCVPALTCHSPPNSRINHGHPNSPPFSTGC